MRKIKYLCFSLFIFLFATSFVGAATCGYEEKAKLNNEVGSVKANYEIIRTIDSQAGKPDYIVGTDEEDDYVAYKELIKINILNLTDNMVVEVKNDYDKTQKTYTYSQAVDGILSFYSPSKNDVIKYTIKIEASDKTGCEGENLRTITVTQPRYNHLSDYAICMDIPEFYLCKKYVTFAEDVDFGTFITKAEKELENQNKKKNNDDNQNKWYEQIGNFVVAHKKEFIIGGITLVVVAGVVTIVIISKRRRDEI